MNDKNYGRIYKNIFDNYIRFTRYTYRDLLDTKKLYDLLKGLSIPKFSFSDLEDFQVYLEFLSAVNIIKPFCVIENDLPSDFYIITESNRNRVAKAHFNKKILYSTEIYGSSNISDNLNLKWDWQNFIYFWHPIQVFQIMAHYEYMSLEKLYRMKEYHDFLFSHFPEKQYEFQKPTFNNNPFGKRYFFTPYWLSEERLLFWMKIENICGFPFIKHSNFPNSIVFRVDTFEKNKNKINSFFRKANRWAYSWKKKMDLLLTSDEIVLFKEFYSHFLWKIKQYDFHGLQNLVDLFILINPSQLRLLNGYLWLWGNYIQIFKTLCNLNKVLSISVSDYQKILPEFGDPLFSFDSKNEYFSHLKDLLLKYSILPQSSFSIYFEGETEEILLSTWKDIVFSRFQIDVCLYNLKSKSAKKHFLNNFKNLKGIDQFLLLDEDVKGYLEKHLSGWKDIIPKENYEFFYPDLVTANFTIDEIISIFSNYVDKDNEIESDPNKQYQFDEKEEKRVRKKLEEKPSEGKQSKYENILDEFYSSSFGGTFNKPRFAKAIREYIFESANSDIESIHKFKFIRILSAFIDKIRFRKFPKILDDLEKD